MEGKEVIFYWLKTAEHDFETMLSLFKSKRYSDCLFFGHITLEKILKALVVQNTQAQAPFTHDLLVLYKKTGNLELSEEEANLLDEVNRFNIRARYPDYKLRFYKQCNFKYTKPYFEEITRLYKKLCHAIK